MYGLCDPGFEAGIGCSSVFSIMSHSSKKKEAQSSIPEFPVTIEEGDGTETASRDIVTGLYNPSLILSSQQLFHMIVSGGERWFAEYYVVPWIKACQQLEVSIITEP